MSECPNVRMSECPNVRMPERPRVRARRGSRPVDRGRPVRSGVGLIGEGFPRQVADQRSAYHECARPSRPLGARTWRVALGNAAVCMVAQGRTAGSADQRSAYHECARLSRPLGAQTWRVAFGNAAVCMVAQGRTAGRADPRSACHVGRRRSSLLDRRHSCRLRRPSGAVRYTRRRFGAFGPQTSPPPRAVGLGGGLASRLRTRGPRTMNRVSARRSVRLRQVHWCQWLPDCKK
jgi:hypothetical protein